MSSRGRRGKGLLTTLGRVPFARSWYQCEPCSQGRFPDDERLESCCLHFGQRPSHAQGKFEIRPCVVRITVHDPVPTAGRFPDGRKKIMEQVRQAIKCRD